MPAIGKHRDAIVNAAVTLFRRRGYSGTGLNDIVALSGAPKGSLYHYFPEGKASIAEAAVARAGERGARTLEELASSRRSAGALVRAYCELMAGWLQKSNFSDGSPITTTLLEMAPADRRVTQAGRAAFLAWRTIIARKLQDDGVAGARAVSLAMLAIAAIDGSLVQARVERSGEPVRSVGRELEALLDAASAGSKERKR